MTENTKSSSEKTLKTGTWLERKNIAKIDNIEQANLRWKYECSNCGFLSQFKEDYCIKCKAKMY